MTSIIVIAVAIVGFANITAEGPQVLQQHPEKNVIRTHLDGIHIA